MNAKVVFFDICNTLVEGAALSARRLLSARLELTEKETHRAGKLLMTHPAESPEDLLVPLGRLLPRFGEERLRRELTELWEEQLRAARPFPGAVELVAGLRGLGLKTGLVSNIWHPFYQSFADACPEIAENVDYTVLSYRLGIKKPDPEIYREALRLAVVPPRRCWMVGDSIEQDIQPAMAGGMRTMLIVSRPERERRPLAALLRGELPRPHHAEADLAGALAFFQRSLA